MLLAGASSRRALGGSIWYKSVSHTFKRTHIPGKLISPEGMRSLVQRPGNSAPYPSDLQFGRPNGQRVGLGVNALATPALNCNSSLKGRGTACEHTSPSLLPSVWCDPFMVSHTPGATWSRPKLSTCPVYQEGPGLP